MVGQDGEINWNFTVQFYQICVFSIKCPPKPPSLKSSFRPPSLQGYKFIFTTTSIRSTNYKITWRTLVRLLSRKIISCTTTFSSTTSRFSEKCEIRQFNWRFTVARCDFTHFPDPTSQIYEFTFIDSTLIHTCAKYFILNKPF